MSELSPSGALRHVDPPEPILPGLDVNQLTSAVAINGSKRHIFIGVGGLVSGGIGGAEAPLLQLGVQVII